MLGRRRRETKEKGGETVRMAKESGLYEGYVATEGVFRGGRKLGVDRRCGMFEYG